MQIPCVYIPGPAPAVSVANTPHIVYLRRVATPRTDLCMLNTGWSLIRKILKVTKILYLFPKAQFLTPSCHLQRGVDFPILRTRIPLRRFDKIRNRLEACLLEPDRSFDEKIGVNKFSWTVPLLLFRIGDSAFYTALLEAVFPLFQIVK